MNPTIGFIVPNEAMKQLVESLFATEIALSAVLVEIIKRDKQEIIEQGQRMVQEGANAIVARGGGYDILHGNLGIPVVDWRINTTDVMHALNEARVVAAKIYLVLHESTAFEYKEWVDLVKLDVTVVRFQLAEIMEVESFLKEIREDDAVIVGGGVVTSMAERLGLKTVFIVNTESNIQEKYQQAIEWVRTLQDREKRLKVLATILDNVADAVVVTDKKGVIEHANNPARLLLQNSTAAAEWGQRSLLDEVPELEMIFDVLKDKSVANRIVNLNDRLWSVTAVPLIVEGKKLGIVCTAQDITQIQKLEKKIRYQLHQKGLVAKYTFADIVTVEPAVSALVETAKDYATTNFTILIYGESGTGKELFAQSIHNWNDRKKSPFVAVNCAALSESLLESELFGYEEGAFTGARKGGKQGVFELAHGGTIFLDEINSISPALQSKLLRVLEEKEVMRLGSDYVIPLDIRIIVAANEELTTKVMLNEFRSDLFYRLSVLELRLPPLRERKRDILVLFNYFLQEMKVEAGALNPELKEKLVQHSWPGNIRELRNVVERYRLLKDKTRVGDLMMGAIGEKMAIDANMKIDLKEINKTVENLIIESLLQKGMSKSDVASLLGISRTALWKKTQ